jgi:hypothetical protein
MQEWSDESVLQATSTFLLVISDISGSNQDQIQTALNSFNINLAR